MSRPTPRLRGGPPARGRGLAVGLVVLVFASPGHAAPVSPEVLMELPSLDRTAPARLAPIVVEGVRYEATWGSNRGELTAVDVATNRRRWAVEAYRTRRVKGLEADVQDVFLTSLRAESATTLLMEDEHHRVYRVDLAKKTVRIAVWPVGLRVLSRTPLRVEVQLHNPLTTAVAFDRPSVGAGGTLSNNLFTVMADGAPVAYRGMLAKRAPPRSYLVIAPGARFAVELALDADYPVPAGARAIEVQFAHHNHFSKDDFDLRSSVVVAH